MCRGLRIKGGRPRIGGAPWTMDTLKTLLREAVRETVAEVLQTVLNADREAFLQEHGRRKNGY